MHSKRPRLSCYCVFESEVLVTQSGQTLCDPWTVAYKAPLSKEFSRQEYWSCHFLLRGIILIHGLNPILQHCSQILFQLSHKRSKQAIWLSRWILCQAHSLTYLIGAGLAHEESGQGVNTLVSWYSPTDSHHCGLSGVRCSQRPQVCVCSH